MMLNFSRSSKIKNLTICNKTTLPTKARESLNYFGMVYGLDDRGFWHSDRLMVVYEVMRGERVGVSR